MKNEMMRVHHGRDHGSAPRARHASLAWIVLGVLAVASLWAASWALRARAHVQPAPGTAGGELLQRTVELIGYASSIRLTPEQEKVKADALSAIPAPAATATPSPCAAAAATCSGAPLASRAT